MDRHRLRGMLAAPGLLRRTRPLSEHSGYDRGTPVDRFYVERFLDAHRADIRGRVLEVKDDGYTRRFGSGVTRSDIVDVDPGNTGATIQADLTAASAIPDASFDCFVLTQTLQYLYDLDAVAGHARRILAPGGVLLATAPAISGLGRPEDGARDYWRFTADGLARLFGTAFGDEAIEARGHGNVLATVAFVSGMASEEVSAAGLADDDPRNPLLISVRAVAR